MINIIVTNHSGVKPKNEMIQGLIYLRNFNTLGSPSLTDRLSNAFDLNAQRHTECPSKFLNQLRKLV